MPNPGLRLKEPAIAGYVYNPPQTPPFEKEGLCCKPLAYLTEGESAYRVTSCVYTQMPNPDSGLQSRLRAAPHIYIPSKPPFDKGGFVVSLAAYLTSGESSPVR